MDNILKVEFYDEFSCIANRCSFTCCVGWEVSVDSETYSKWKYDKKQSEYFCKKVKIGSNKTEVYIKMGPHMRCPLLDDKGLCNIVIKCGENYLPKTCRIFPRQENKFGDLLEYSLSCTCPAVVDIINNIHGKMKFSYDGDESIWDNVEPEYKIREAMIAIMQSSRFSFKDKILLIFHMLLLMKKELVITKETVSKYQDEKYLLSLTTIWNGIEIDHEETCRETNELFLDIVSNYRKEKNYISYLQDISELAENLDTKDSHTQWNDFEIVFEQNEKLIENCIVSKIFTNCVNEDIDELIMSFQMLVTEYVMVKYSVFLKWIMENKKEIDYNTIRDFIVVYSRIIGYNADGMKEFWEDSFDEAIWEFGYMLLLIN